MMKAWKSIFVLCSFLLMLSGCFHQEEKKAEPKKKESIPETKEYGGRELKKLGKSERNRMGYFQVRADTFCESNI